MQTGVPASMRGVQLFKHGQRVGGCPPSILVPALHNESACHQAQYASLKRAIAHCTGGPECGLNPEVIHGDAVDELALESRNFGDGIVVLYSPVAPFGTHA
jgi:hypothetical protein